MYKILSQDGFWIALGIIILIVMLAVEAVKRLADYWQVGAGEAVGIICLTSAIVGGWLVFMVYVFRTLFGSK